MNTYYVYFLTNIRKTVLYVGVTSNLQRRVSQHKSGLLEGFTKKYNVRHLIYFEQFKDIEKAIAREKQLKGWSRIKKNRLIASTNPSWIEIQSS